MRYEVEISNRQSLSPVDEARLLRIAEQTLASENVCEAEIVVAIVDDPTIHQINREFLNHDYPTDVISFVYDAQRMGDREVDPSCSRRGAELHLDGEIVISMETALRDAAEFSWSAENELTLYLVHGLLHLCGYDDQTEEDRLEMRQREKEILKNWDLTPNYR